MAIRKEEEKKIGMKITDNMDGEKKANNKLMAKYEPGKVFSMGKYREYLQAVKEDKVKEVFPDESIFELERMRKIFEAQNKDL